MMKRKLIPVILAGLLLLLSGCGGSDYDKGINGEMGEPMQTAFFTFTVTGGSQSLRDIQPPEESVWMISVHVVNTQDSDVTLYYDDFDLVVDGEPRFPERPEGDNAFPDRLTLSAGAEAEGQLLFIVPKGTKRALLVYDEYYEGDTVGDRYSVTIQNPAHITSAEGH